MKNKKWKRQAKRLKGKADYWCECEFCDLRNKECYGACGIDIRKLEKRIKSYKNYVHFLKINRII